MHSISSEPLMTFVDLLPSGQRIGYDDHLFLMGSCFSEHIGNTLRRYKYSVTANPFGILYNPVSMMHAFQRIARRDMYTPAELIFDQGMYHSPDHHGSFSGRDQEEVISKINASLLQAHEALATTGYFIISPGSAFAYTYLPTGMIAGNCHKIPASQFSKNRLSVDQCIEALSAIASLIMDANPDAQIIWTVSPVRHIRDGLVENQRSKSTLLLAIDHLLHQQGHHHYFPAYEIMIDQLRDYRFYQRDMIHPSAQAIDCIWSAFAGVWLDALDCTYHPMIDQIQQARSHRFLHPEKEAIISFARKQLARIDHLASALPDRDWHEERQYFFHLTERD